MITALPSPPSTNDPSNFATKADALLAALPNFVTEANATAVAMNLNSTTDTSASSVAIGTGAKSFTVSTGKSFQPGMYLVIADTAAPSTNSMVGQITSYDAVTGALVINILMVRGSGTKTAWIISQTSAVGGVIAQSVKFQTGALATGTTLIPFDDTVPQNTEGDQYMSVTITPQNAASTLVIDVDWYGASSVVNYLAMGLFQDSTAEALKSAITSGIFQAHSPTQISLHHEMTAGTTSATTFKVRVGAITAGITTFNGLAGGGYFGGSLASHISIKEILP